jgi:hypothetical protein
MSQARAAEVHMGVGAYRASWAAHRHKGAHAIQTRHHEQKYGPTL